MADLEKTRKNLEGRGFRVHRFASGAEAAEFLVQTLHGTSIGIGGSVTIDTLGVYDRLCGSTKYFGTGRTMRRKRESGQGRRRPISAAPTA